MGGSLALRPSLRTVSSSQNSALFRVIFLDVESKAVFWNSFSSEGAEIDCEDKNGNTPLHIAARYGHELLINTLITNCADTAK